MHVSSMEKVNKFTLAEIKNDQQHYFVHEAFRMYQGTIKYNNLPFYFNVMWKTNT
jgi:hypothetical protein